MQPQPQDFSARTIAASHDIASLLSQQGWCVYPDFLDPDTVAALRQAGERAWRTGRLRPAGVGRGENLQIMPEVRSDQVLWLDPAHCDETLGSYFAALEVLRLNLNRDLCLGLFDYEAHLAVYPPGSFYRKHLDQFRGIGSRILTTTFYLNHNWQPAHGGQLRLYTDVGDAGRYVDILPAAGTLVCFLSADFLHEVLPATRERLSITGWFRRREA